ncbi:MAG: carboxypeptidase-like regulatory domain-containing protein [Bacteroidales bacterium]|nr:carboxypeptidase-like regulatory domain-containing protein [Bacteroidales bacterium]
MRRFIYILPLLIMLSSCRKEEVLMTGTISGALSIYDQFHKKSGDASGAEITLYDTLGPVQTTLTDKRGKYTFDDVPYGRYVLVPSKEKYIRSKNSETIYHIGGYSPTITSLYLFEIPTHQVFLDSAAYFEENGYLIVYLKINGGTTLPPNTYGIPFIACAGSSADVSMEKHDWIWKGIFADYSFVSYPAETVSVYGMIPRYSFSNTFNPAPGTFFIRVYPLANGQGYYTDDFYPEALGKPSNVISFSWN